MKPVWIVLGVVGFMTNVIFLLLFVGSDVSKKKSKLREGNDYRR